MSRLAVVCAAIAAGGCVTYDFEPVTPLAVAQTTKTIEVKAKGKKPNVMLLVDKSGSMNDPVDPACTVGCKKRIDDLRSAMGGFLSQSGSVARFGLSTFPKGGGTSQCLPPDAVSVDISASNDLATELSAHAAEIDTVIQTLGAVVPVGGGTPTAASLGFLGQLSSLNTDDREDFVLLLTDGLPNCNAASPATCGVGGTCQCTLPSGCASACPLGCLDDDASIQAVRALATSKIRTIVVGFGGDTTGSTLLDRMAVEGGMPRTCQADADCGTGGPCSAGLCKTKYYQANDGAQLGAVLKKIADGLTQAPCLYELGFTPSPDAKFAVIVDGQSVAADPVNGWRYDASRSAVEAVGALCARAEASSTSQPLNVVIRVLEPL